jgi:hypothetical protein
MNSTTLVVPEFIAEQVRSVLGLEVETGGVILARLVLAPDGDIRLLATDFRLVPDEAYERRERSELFITSDGYVPALGVAEETGTVPIWFHTHPGEGASPRPSRRDGRVDAELADLFRLRSGSDYYGALIVSHRGAGVTFTGHLESAEEERINIDRLFIVGPRFGLMWSDLSDQEPLTSFFDRNIRAFGGEVQRVLNDLHIAVIGCGGTGSAVAEQLVRLGVRRLLLMDPDTLSDSNITRVYGSQTEDIGRPKVDVLADHLRRISPEADIRVCAGMLTSEANARQMVGVDLVFGCTDDNAGRLVLSRFATYMLAPVIDCGVLMTSDLDGRLSGIHGRVTLLYPGAACLVCRHRVDLARASSELLTPEERVRRVDEGYAPALEGVEPAVVAYTTMVAAAAVGELLERLIGYGPDEVPSEILLRIHDREVSTNQQEPRERHYCHPASGKLGRGLTEPFLEQTWAA